MAYLVIDPDETLDYDLEWAKTDDSWLDTDTIASSSWAISPAGPTLTGEANTTTTATVFVGSATLGETYRLTNTIITAAGRTADRTVTLRCEAR